MVCRSCRRNWQKNAMLSFYLCTVLACKRPTASLAPFMCNPPAFSSSIDLAKKNEAVAETLLQFRHKVNVKFWRNISGLFFSDLMVGSWMVGAWLCQSKWVLLQLLQHQRVSPAWITTQTHLTKPWTLVTQSENVVNPDHSIYTFYKILKNSTESYNLKTIFQCIYCIHSMDSVGLNKRAT